eukprot:gb/GECH01012303.1/.p1 GENE.gb/GECH01012303.1/~~gb/GECH01012303.1/.p1  ORF type:complete len:480 (+),score=99.85 gb/GECH01012303.1/:1-1440(+)
MLARNSSSRISSSSRLSSSSQLRGSFRSSVSRFNNNRSIFTSNESQFSIKNLDVNNQVLNSYRGFSTSSILRNEDMLQEHEIGNEERQDYQEGNERQWEEHKASFYEPDQIDTEEKAAAFIKDHSPKRLTPFLLGGLNTIAKKEGVRAAWRTFRRMYRNQYSLSNYAWNKMAQLASTHKSAMTLIELMKEMQHSSVFEPELHTYESYFRVVHDDALLSEVLEKYGDSPRVNRLALRYYTFVSPHKENALKYYDILYETGENNAITDQLMLALAESREEFNSYMAKVEESEVQINDSTWISILNKIQSDDVFFHALKTSNILESTHPDLLALALRYTAAHVDINDPEQTEAIKPLIPERTFIEAFRARIKVNFTYLNDLLTALGREADLPRIKLLAIHCRNRGFDRYALKLLSKIQDLDATPLSTILIIVNTLANRGRVEAVKQIMESYPDAVTPAWEDALAKAQRVREEQQQAHEEMEE